MYQIGTDPTARFAEAYGDGRAETAPYADASPVRACRRDGVSTSPFGFAGGFGAGAASGASGTSGGFGGVMASFYGAIQNLFAQIQSTFGADPSASAAAGDGAQTGETAFASATASSLGDPHLAFDGTAADGSKQSGHWDDMRSHADLLDSASFRGGYQVSTSTTTPDANGVTYNDHAVVATNGGATTVEFAKDGSYAVTRDGESVALAKGQTLALGRGESVTANGDGSLTVSDHNRRGGSIATTLRSNGSGVDVSTSATHVALGGYLIDGRDATPGGVAPTATGDLGWAPGVSDLGAWSQPATPWQSYATPATGATSAASATGANPTPPPESVIDLA